ncbi:uncharacterized protein LOC119307386 [Triticum dicoccoides]|uniref:uncharacterized protein LOC119307386 n=1 Tax=Triticum dicoccoides TaxID=85692 RepID=UPI00188E4607|nr:uncharacterized protein LOC119307386 [Triticum dicoccoides]
MVASASVRYVRRRRGRPPGIRASVNACVRRTGEPVPPADSSSVTPAVAMCRQSAGVHSGRRSRSAVARQPLCSRRPGVQCSDSEQFLHGDFHSRRREISLGKRPVDSTVDSVISCAPSFVGHGFPYVVRPAGVPPGNFCCSFFLIQSA